MSMNDLKKKSLYYTFVIIFLVQEWCCSAVLMFPKNAPLLWNLYFYKMLVLIFLCVPILFFISIYFLVQTCKLQKSLIIVDDRLDLENKPLPKSMFVEKSIKRMIHFRIGKNNRHFLCNPQIYLFAFPSDFFHFHDNRSMYRIFWTSPELRS